MNVKNTRTLLCSDAHLSTKSQLEHQQNQEEPMNLRSFRDEKSPFGVPYMELEGSRNIDVVGEGQFCSVFSFSMPESGQKVAIKLQKKNNILDLGTSDIYKEAGILSHLQKCPNNHVVRLRGVSHPCSHQVFLVMDLLSETLLQKLEEWWIEESLKTTARSGLQQRLRYRRVLRTNHLAFFRERRRQSLYRLVNRLEVAIDLARAIQFIHSKGVIHRDIKPGNIGLNHRGQVRLIDFGLSEKVTQEVNRISGIAGSRSYMAPEIISGSMKYGSVIDVYSFGVVLWEICYLEPAAQRVKSRIPFSIPEQWPQPLRRVSRSCCHKHPSKRPDWGITISSLKESIDLIREEKINAMQEESEAAPAPDFDLIQQFRKLFQRRKVRQDSA